jgi:hypothetical protein
MRLFVDCLLLAPLSPSTPFGLRESRYRAPDRSRKAAPAAEPTRGTNVVSAICLTMLHCGTRFMMANADHWQEIFARLDDVG